MDAKQYLSIKEYALSYIENYILQHRLEVGSKLPSVSAFSKMMKIGASSVREALTMLEAQGKIETHNGKGSYVTQATQQVLISAQVAESSIQKHLIEIFAVRKMLEREIVELTVRTATPQQLDELRDRVDRLMFKYNNDLNTTAEDRLFHASLNKSCGNSILQGLADSVMQVFNKMYPHDINLHSTYDTTVPLHEEMFHAVLKGDAAAAVEINNQVFDVILQRLVAL